MSADQKRYEKEFKERQLQQSEAEAVRRMKHRPVIIGSTAAGKDRVTICRGRNDEVAFLYITIHVEGASVTMSSREFVRAEIDRFAAAIAKKLGIEPEYFT